MSGSVVDFIDLQWWPIFNVADTAVVLGGILLAVSMVFEPSGSQPES
jgi:signal peptidase II